MDALLGIVQRLGSAWRPWEQSPTEGEHQETQRSLGTLLKSVFTCAPGEWAGLLPVVEFIRFNTPGAAGVSPRDLDRSWSIASPLERELLPLDEGESQSVAEVVRKQFDGFRRMRETVLAHRAREGAARVEIANKGRSTKIMEVDDRLLLRDPSRRRAKAGHGPGKPTPAGPLKIVAARGNLLDLKHMETGVTHEAVHAENVVLLPTQVHDYEHPKREALHIVPDPTTSSLADSRRSPGQLIEAEPFNDGGVEKSKGPLLKARMKEFAVGRFIA